MVGKWNGRGPQRGGRQIHTEQRANSARSHRTGEDGGVDDSAGSEGWSVDRQSDVTDCGAAPELTGGQRDAAVVSALGQAGSRR